MSEQQIIIMPLPTVSAAELAALRHIKAGVEMRINAQEVIVKAWQNYAVDKELTTSARASLNESLAILAQLRAILVPQQPDETQEIEVVNDV